jgi:hypothetical protein
LYGLTRFSRSLDRLADFGSIGGSIVSPVYINSAQDEAYRLLKAVVESGDPFREQQTTRVSVRKRAAAVIERSWTEVTAGQPPFSARQAAMVVALLVVTAGAAAATAAGVDGSPPYFYAAACAGAMLLMVLGVKVTAVLNALVGFSLQIVKYPVTQIGLRLVRRMAWPFLKASALGLSGAPGASNAVTVAMVPPERRWSLFEFKELPPDLITRVSLERQHSAQDAFNDALDRIFKSDWTPEKIRAVFAQLNHPDLIHSCYYQYLDHGWVVAEIAENIAYREYVDRNDADALDRQIDRQEAAQAKMPLPSE